jgi:hypothetical protein
MVLYAAAADVVPSPITAIGGWIILRSKTTLTSPGRFGGRAFFLSGWTAGLAPPVM